MERWKAKNGTGSWTWRTLKEKNTVVINTLKVPCICMKKCMKWILVIISSLESDLVELCFFLLMSKGFPILSKNSCFVFICTLHLRLNIHIPVFRWIMQRREAGLRSHKGLVTSNQKHSQSVVFWIVGLPDICCFLSKSSKFAVSVSGFLKVHYSLSLLCTFLSICTRSV